MFSILKTKCVYLHNTFIGRRGQIKHFKLPLQQSLQQRLRSYNRIRTFGGKFQNRQQNSKAANLGYMRTRSLSFYSQKLL